MQRRHSLQLLAAGLPALVACGTGRTAATPAAVNRTPATDIIKPKQLQKGDLVRLVTPGGPVTEARITQARENLEGLGLTVSEGANIRARRGQHAGTDAQRLDDLHAAFRDPRVKAIWAIRGGDGSSRLLGQLDYALIRQHPKILIGFSDITALLQAIRLETGLVGFHGPIAAWELTGFNLQSLKATLVGAEKGGQFVYEPGRQTAPLAPGAATGELAGGNLSILAALAGTPHALNANGKIVFLEDVGEAPRRIDRMLTTLLDAAGERSLRNARGIILGEFVDCDCEKKPDDADECAGNSLTLAATLRDRLGGLGIPVLENFPFGHRENLCTFPVGTMARLDANGSTVQLLESPVSA